MTQLAPAEISFRMPKYSSFLTLHSLDFAFWEVETQLEPEIPCQASFQSWFRRRTDSDRQSWPSARSHADVIV